MNKLEIYKAVNKAKWVIQNRLKRIKSKNAKDINVQIYSIKGGLYEVGAWYKLNDEVYYEFLNTISLSKKAGVLACLRDVFNEVVEV